MKPLLAALRFLTVLPLGARAQTAAEDLGRSLPFFPLAGALIGAAAAALSLGAAWALPAWPAAVVVVAGGVLFSGGLHLDGLSDSADGLLSSRPRERALEIMRDGRAGPMGVFAVVCVMFLKISALACLVPLKDGQAFWRAAFLMPVAGRAAILVSMAVLPYARPAGGLGSAFYSGARRASAVWALVFLVAAGWLLLGRAGLAAASAALAVTLVFAAWTWKRLGGATGDTLGAACELAEAAAVAALAGWMFHVPQSAIMGPP